MHALHNAGTPSPDTDVTRQRVQVSGVVQGVGFRPFVYRLARQHGLTGSVQNDGAGARIEIEGRSAAIGAFMADLNSRLPTGAELQSIKIDTVPCLASHGFELLSSSSSGMALATILPDLATCPDCYQEIFNPANRRYRYPFTNCTQCGPRFSILEGLPYDRENTTMRHFSMCRQCEEEFSNPMDRRFHAQPNACADCGPQLTFHDRKGRSLEQKNSALQAVVRQLRGGAIVAMKGIGGFQLLVDAGNEQAVQRLRQRKQRPGKPLAVMVRNSSEATGLCIVSALEEALLCAPQAPIVLLQRKCAGLASSVTPELDQLGLMLPYSPLHHLLLHEFAAPLVVTSGNMAGEPICINRKQALQQLGEIADYFLLHDRGIARPIDDSVVRIAAGRPMLLRRARGYAPLPVRVNKMQRSALALGGQLKNTIGLALQDQIILSQHIGDLGSVRAQQQFAGEISSLTQYFGAQPEILIHDKHPDYSSTRWAQQQHQGLQSVQHHIAHVFACMADNELQADCLGVAWDGTGYGDDGSLWGGEFFAVSAGAETERCASFRTFSLPGAAAAIREPRRAALGLLYEMHGDELWDRSCEFVSQAFSCEEINVLKAMLSRQLNSPRTSSVGRLFDAVAALMGLRWRIDYEAEAAMQLEQLAAKSAVRDFYPFTLTAGGLRLLDWQPMVQALLEDQQRGVAAQDIAARFHNTLARTLLIVAQQSGHDRVALAGGCFQNRVLLEKCIALLQAHGFEAFWPRQLPPNDGGLAAGQLYWSAQQGESEPCA